MLFPLILLATAFRQQELHQIEKFDGFEIVGLAARPTETFYGKSYAYLQAMTVVKGKLPGEGPWCMKVMAVTADGSPVHQDYFGQEDIYTDEEGRVQHRTGGPLFWGGAEGAHLHYQWDKPLPSVLTMRCELVHYQSIEETAEFPGLRLDSPYGDKPESDMGIFTPVIGEKGPLATTERGLVLRIERFDTSKVGGFSGPKKWAIIPISIDPKTLSLGLDDQLKRLNAESVDRVNARAVGPPARESWRGSTWMVLYSSGVKERGEVHITSEQVMPVIDLKLQIARLIVDRRFKFDLTLPVQDGKNTNELILSQDQDKMPIWPTTTNEPPANVGKPPQRSRKMMKGS